MLIPQNDNFEFWSQRLAGEFDRELKAQVEPESVAVLSVHPQADAPSVISTDRHFTQSAVELVDVGWDTSTNTLSGTSLGPIATAHNVTIYIPPAYRWDAARPEYFQESGEYSVSSAAPNILRMRIRFDTSTVTKWQVKFIRTK